MWAEAKIKTASQLPGVSPMAPPTWEAAMKAVGQSSEICGTAAV